MTGTPVRHPTERSLRSVDAYVGGDSAREEERGERDVESTSTGEWGVTWSPSPLYQGVEVEVVVVVVVLANIVFVSLRVCYV